MQWSAKTTEDVARAYHAQYALGSGDRRERLDADEHFWAWEAINSAIFEGTLPLDVVDALLHLAPDDEAFQGYVAAGPVEDLLVTHPEKYTDAIAERCRQDGVWAQAVGNVWLDRRTWDSVPESL